MPYSQIFHEFLAKNVCNNLFVCFEKPSDSERKTFRYCTWRISWHWACYEIATLSKNFIMAGHQVVIANQCWFADVYLAIEATFAFLNEHKIYPEGLNNCSSVEILPSYYNRRVDYWKKGNNHYKPRLSAPNLYETPERPHGLQCKCSKGLPAAGRNAGEFAQKFDTVSVTSNILKYLQD